MGETFSYEFKNFYHPFVADLIKKLNQTSVAGMLDPDFLAGLGGQPYPACRLRLGQPVGHHRRS